MDEIKCSEAYSTAKNAVKCCIKDTKQNFIYIGHYLKEIRDSKLYQEDGYADFDTFMTSEIGKDKSWASRCINVASQFGIVENGQPALAEQYQDYSLSLLIEMVAMTPEQRELVTPDTEVKAAREIKKTGKEKSCESQLPEPGLEEQKPFQRGCITGKSRYGTCSCCGSDGVQCCGQCGEPCNGRCGWLDEPWEGGPEPPAPEKESEQKDEFSVTWFIRRWISYRYNDFQRAIRACRIDGSPADKAKAIQKELAPCGYHGSSCGDEYAFTFHGFAGGMDFRVGKEKMHLKYGRLAKELLELFDPWDSEFDEKEVRGREVTPMPVQTESEPEDAEDIEEREEIILRAYVESLPEWKIDNLNEFFANNNQISSQVEYLKSVLALGSITIKLNGVEEQLYLRGLNEGIEIKRWPFREGEDILPGIKILYATYTYLRNVVYAFLEEHRDEILERSIKLRAAKKKQEEAKKKLEQPVEEETVIDAEFTEVPPSEEYTPEYFLMEQQGKLDELLRAFKDDPGSIIPHKLFERQKTIVAALDAMVSSLEPPDEPDPVVQPELPVMKNNDQRAAFVDAYETWPLWIETKETGERYYRYDLPDGTSMVIKVYHARLFDYKATEKPYEDRHSEGYGRHEYYLLKDGKFFRDCETNRSMLIEKLKEIQKKGKG